MCISFWVLGKTADIAHWVGTGLPETVVSLAGPLGISVSVALMCLRAYSEEGAVGDVVEAIVIDRLAGWIKNARTLGSRYLEAHDVKDYVDAAVRKEAKNKGNSVLEKDPVVSKETMENGFKQVKDSYKKSVIKEAITPPDVKTNFEENAQ